MSTLAEQAEQLLKGAWDYTLNVSESEGDIRKAEVAALVSIAKSLETIVELQTEEPDELIGTTRIDV